MSPHPIAQRVQPFKPKAANVGGRGVLPSRSLGGPRGIFSHVREYPPFPELKTAKALGAAYDAAPSHSARNVRFYEGVEHVGIYSDFGRSAMDAALDAFLGDDSTEKLEAFFRSA